MPKMATIENACENIVTATLAVTVRQTEPLNPWPPSERLQKALGCLLGLFESEVDTSSCLIAAVRVLLAVMKGAPSIDDAIRKSAAPPVSLTHEHVEFLRANNEHSAPCANEIIDAVKAAKHYLADRITNRYILKKVVKDVVDFSLEAPVLCELSLLPPLTVLEKPESLSLAVGRCFGIDWARSEYARKGDTSPEAYAAKILLSAALTVRPLALGDCFCQTLPSVADGGSPFWTAHDEACVEHWRKIILSDAINKSKQRRKQSGPVCASPVPCKQIQSPHRHKKSKRSRREKALEKSSHEFAL